jgi:hypothetical protein
MSQSALGLLGNANIPVLGIEKRRLSLVQRFDVRDGVADVLPIALEFLTVGNSQALSASTSDSLVSDGRAIANLAMWT